jgi:hypothetical protein
MMGSLTVEELREIAAAVETKPGPGITARRALLVANDLSYGVSRMFEICSQHGTFEYRAFRDEAEALERFSLPS